MDDAPQDPETSSGRAKRSRIRTQNQERVSDASDDGPNQAEREASPDDFEDVRPKAKRNRPSELQKSDQSLIEVIKGNGKNIPQAVKLWVEEYEKNQKPAMVELLTMLFEACGAKFCIKEELLDETDVDDVVVALVNLARKGEVEDYQSSKRKDVKNFKDNLVSFWDNLVVECQNGPLFDKVLFDKCMDYIIALSCTPPRVYRQIASTIGLQLVTSFITVAKTLGAQRETTQRQLNAEKKKRTDGPRVESLNKRLSMTHEKIVVLEDMMRKIFTGLFVHRYRDIDPNIRMSCIESLGVWILSYPSLFLQDLYLKYLGWTLNDKSAGVRKASILALQSLYDVDDNVPTLGLFTERFSNRMIELADDIDVSVAVCAIGLVKQLLRHQLLPDDDLGPLYDLLIDDPADIRRAIGELVYDHLIAQKLNSSQSGSRGNENGSEVHLSRMLQILREFSTEPILSTYVVDDVWEYMKAMKDWKCIISMLLDENPLVELTDDDATNLVRLLFASVRKAVGERIVPASDNRKQYYNKAQKEVFENNRKDITIAMMKNYPLLLRKFMADKAKIPSLVEIIVHMNLELYSLKRQEQNFKNVLQLMKESFFKHGEKEALRSCVKAILFCSTESQGELKDFAGNKLKNLEDELIAKLKSAMKEAVGGDEYSLLVNLKRLYELQLSKAVPIESIFEDIVKVIHSFRNVDDDVVSFLLLNMYLHVAWSLQSIVNSETISEAQLSSLLSKRNILFEELEYFLGTPSEEAKVNKYSNHLACRVCIILAEAWCLFRHTNFSSTKLESLGCCPDTSVVQKFWELCEQQLNISDETDDEDTNKEYIEETNRDAVMIAAAKLIASDTVSKESLAPGIISHFVMHGTSVAEIVKHLLTIIKKKDDDISNIFLEALKRAHQWHLEELSKSDDGSVLRKSFQDCKDLAARLSGTFMGAARNKHRADILKIIKEGIEYAFKDAPKQLSFLESAMLHFVSKLPTPDVLEILKDVQSRTENVNTDEDPSGWRPYFTFVDNLREKYAKNEGLPDEKEGTNVRRRGRPRKRQNIEGKRLFDEHSSGEEEDSISGSDQEDAQEEEEEKQDEEEEDEAPLIHSFRSSGKLRSLKVFKG
ncbi:sister-chromatid cohesion protein 3 isoform X2 [Ricinus communis]|uniref:Stromal antigen, putative n=1 Tax=Ricinus communis TaxID=3988 RepID=B9S3Y7_RICCO|nr:sister-chromatid cohesion protein 3 isoform X2 [Ricinus communis]EEF41668.1 stromal antigen, putative [Ricinus communis]|eukprot:XP_002520706.1 sister-chromatid cohesion protein 3 [Ricinus communis]